MAGNYSNTGSWVPNIYSRPGLRNVGSYLVSGRPHITVVKFPAAQTSTDYGLRVEFPYVTKRIVVFHSNFNRKDTLKVTFQSASAGNVISNFHYFETTPNHNSYIEIEAKCKEIFVYAYGDPSDDTKTHPTTVLGWATVYAELTNIPTASMFHLTGSGITE